MISRWIESYHPKSVLETEQALREIMQEIALAGLYRSDFFKHAAFYGGTALRIFHGLNRFSEDLDFSLLEKNPDFELQAHLKTVADEFNALGFQVSFRQKPKSIKTKIDSAFLKSDTLWGALVLENTIPQLKLSGKPSIKIKLEVDTDPPLGFETENQLLTRPFSFYVNCFTLPDLFAGKMHALLFRNWKSRVKGRDWYDFEWYLKNGTELNLNHLHQRSIGSGDWTGATFSREQFMDLLTDKINTTDLNQAKEDVVRFIPDPENLEIWSRAYFQKLIKTIKFI